MSVLTYQRINRALKPIPDASSSFPSTTAAAYFTVTRDNTSMPRRPEQPWVAKCVCISSAATTVAGYAYIGGDAISVPDHFPVVEEGVTYTVSNYYYTTVANCPAYYVIYFMQEDINAVVTSLVEPVANRVSGPANTWNRANYTFTVPTGMGITRARVYMWLAIPSGYVVKGDGTEISYLTDTLFEEGSTVGTYFDGSMKNCSWAVTANFSFSVQTVTTAFQVTAPSYQLFKTDMRWRYICQNILTGDFTHWDLPLKRNTLTWELSGPGALQGTIAPEIYQLGALNEWQTAIYAEADDQIRWGGILQNVSFNGAEMTLDCAGFSSYATAIPYLGPLYSKIGISPLVVWKMLWDYMQAQPDGNLGLSTITTGSPATLLGSTTQPYLLNPDEAPDIGQELTSLAQEAPFDYFEDHEWSGSSQTITHTLTAAYPRVGRKRTDLAFSSDSNIIQVVPVTRSGDSYANIIYGLGKGTGKAMIRGEVAQRDGRLRRPYVFTDKLATTVARLTTELRQQYAGRQLLPDIASIVVKNHPNARIGSWQVGDDILVQTTLPWLGDITVWGRVVSWSLESESTATINLVRSDSFNYGG